jgi:predicted DNA-binding protein (MmcQ/YjbR family)
MNIESFREYCLSKPGTFEDLPFGPDVLVFKVMGKLFALTDIDRFESINLKCDPALAIELREQYEGIVLPGYHMNKKHWNTILMDGRIPDPKIMHWINHSYELVVASLPKKLRTELKEL